MRITAMLLAALILAGCAGGPTERDGLSPANHDTTESATRDAPPDSLAQFLLGAAAADFHEHRPPDPARFRSVRVGYVPTPEGDPRYFMCGQFTTEAQGDAAQWTAFVTIKTTPYEHWIGAFATEFVRNPAIVWYEAGDLSSALAQKLDALSGTPGAAPR